MNQRRAQLRSLGIASMALAVAGIAVWTAFFRAPRGTDRASAGIGDSPATVGPIAPTIALHKIAAGFEQPTDVQFAPGVRGQAVVLQKSGKARWLDVARGTHGDLFEVAVLSHSEEGLLGLAFDPDFAHNGRFFLNYVAAVEGREVSRVAQWQMTDFTSGLRRARAREVAVVMEVVQPYPNHNAGQLAFGPDGYLYVGWGDGGAANDPHGHGQDGRSLLGSMLRIDVRAAAAGPPGKAYGIPRDNPFVGRPDFAPETWAYGLRNPWRFSFDPSGRLIVADVGQNRWEEIDIVQAGDNLGWNLREGFECFGADPAACERAALVAPVFVYGHDLGLSITGGYVYGGSRLPDLRGWYVFGDFVSGRLMAIALPADRTRPVNEARALGRWAIQPSTFARDEAGELYVADFGAGDLYRLQAR